MYNMKCRYETPLLYRALLSIVFFISFISFGINLKNFVLCASIIMVIMILLLQPCIYNA